MLVGLIADNTHGVLHPGVPSALAGVSRILHAGDVGSEAVLDALGRIAPVDAIRGNADRGALAARLLLVHALGEPARLEPATRRRLTRLGVDVVCFGHSHRALVARHEGLLFVNPGGGGRKRFTLPRSVARLDLSGDRVEAEVVPLAPP